MEKILFIVPPYVSFDSFIAPAFNDGTMIKNSIQYRNVPTDMPIGLISLSSYIKKFIKTETKLLDFNIILHKLQDFDYSSFSELYHDVLLKDEYYDFCPTIIGISALFTPCYHNMLSISQVAKKLFPSAIIIAGGGVPTTMYKEIYSEENKGCFDGLCYGEGEKPLLELVSSKNKIEYLENSTSWITKEKSNINYKFEFDFVHELDEIPMYDYGILHTDDYGLSPTISTFAAINEKEYPFHIATSRGCPHLCSFCASHSVHGRSMRYHSISRIESDLNFLKNHYGVKKIVFQDDHFMSDKDRALKIIDIAKSLDLTVFFQSGLALYALDRKVLEALKGVGITQIVLSVESGSNRVLRDIMHKPLDLSIVRRVTEDCRDLGIATDVTVLIGLPGETKQDIDDALEFLRTLEATWFRINVAAPLPGSELLDICLKNGYLKGNYIDCDFKRSVIETEDFTSEFIQEKAYQMNLELNFVRNTDMKHGKFESALSLFNNVIRVKNDHAFAYYFLSLCYEEMKNFEKSHEYKSHYFSILQQSTYWRDRAQQFGLPSLTDISDGD